MSTTDLEYGEELSSLWDDLTLAHDILGIEPTRDLVARLPESTKTDLLLTFLVSQAL